MADNWINFADYTTPGALKGYTLYEPILGLVTNLNRRIQIGLTSTRFDIDVTGANRLPDKLTEEINGRTNIPLDPNESYVDSLKEESDTAVTFKASQWAADLENMLDRITPWYVDQTQEESWTGRANQGSPALNFPAWSKESLATYVDALIGFGRPSALVGEEPTNKWIRWMYEAIKALTYVYYSIEKSGFSDTQRWQPSKRYYKDIPGPFAKTQAGLDAFVLKFQTLPWLNMAVGGPPFGEWDFAIGSLGPVRPVGPLDIIDSSFRTWGGYTVAVSHYGQAARADFVIPSVNTATIERYKSYPIVTMAGKGLIDYATLPISLISVDASLDSITLAKWNTLSTLSISFDPFAGPQTIGATIGKYDFESS